ncbi:RDD family protein [Actinoplanes sp. NPDC049265]|uniref:RDD family protein n=1 Tax=Actinoplanes sp. NPDC049265 TaxID=3363902 RepID=UPI00371036F2
MTVTGNTLDVHVTGRRVVATLIDGVIFGVISWIVTVLFGTKVETSGFKLTTLSPGGSVLLLVVTLAYYIVLEGVLGRTVGKMATGIKVVREDGATPPGVGAAAIRTLLRVVDGLFGNLVGFIIVLASQKRRRLGDMAAKTLVVRA